MIVLYELKLLSLLRLFLRKKHRLNLILLSNGVHHQLKYRCKIKILEKSVCATIKVEQVDVNRSLNYMDTSAHFRWIEKCKHLSLEFAKSETTRLGLFDFLPGHITDNLLLVIARYYKDELLRNIREIEYFCDNNRLSVENLQVYADSRVVKFLELNYGTKNISISNQIRFERTLSIFLFIPLILLAILTKKFFNFNTTKKHYELSYLTTHQEEFHSETFLRNKLNWYTNIKENKPQLFCIRGFKYRRRFGDFFGVTNHQIIEVRLNRLSFTKFNLVQDYLNDIVKSLVGLFITPKNRSPITQNVSLSFITLFFLWKLENLYAICKQINCGAYVYEDDYIDSHVMNVIASLGHLRTYKIQYSNLGVGSMDMLSNPSTILVFSNEYKKFFEYSEMNLGPKEVREVGFNFQKTNTAIIGRSNVIRSKLEIAGAKFIIGFFDESVQPDEDIWALKSKSAHLSDIHAICNFIIQNEDIGVVFKTQFIKNSLTRLYHGDQLLKTAIETGRFLLPETGEHRNLILPSEIALASDVCIGDLVGATASLEAYMAGTKSLLVDSMKIGKQFRDLYWQSGKVTFTTLEDAFEAIIEFRKNGGIDIEFGNWDYILNTLKLSSDSAASKISQEILSDFLH